MDLLKAAGLGDRLDVRGLRHATHDELLLAHDESYLDYVEHLADVGGNLTLDTPVNRDVMDIQSLIAGSGLDAAKLLVEGEVSIAHTFGGFHHAGRNYGEGFCLYNDVAIVAKALHQNHGVEKVLIIDTDAHQGNGTMDIFWESQQVLFISIHQDPRTLYPGRGFAHEVGAGVGRGYTVNVPMPPYAGFGHYERAMDEIVVPVSRAFEPDIVIRNGGSDPYVGDELTLLSLDYDGLAMLGREVREISDQTCGKLLDMMVSGYGPSVIYGWLALFCGVEKLDIDYKAHSPPEYKGSRGFPENVLDEMLDETIEDVKKYLEPHWDL